jgi:hypothetical protein
MAEKEAKIEKESFEAIFGSGVEVYDNPMESPEKTKTTATPSPVTSENEDSANIPDIVSEDDILVMDLAPEKLEAKVKKIRLKIENIKII